MLENKNETLYRILYYASIQTIIKSVIDQPAHVHVKWYAVLPMVEKTAWALKKYKSDVAVTPDSPFPLHSPFPLALFQAYFRCHERDLFELPLCNATLSLRKLRDTAQD